MVGAGRGEAREGGEVVVAGAGTAAVDGGVNVGVRGGGGVGVGVGGAGGAGADGGGAEGGIKPALVRRGLAPGDGRRGLVDAGAMVIEAGIPRAVVTADRRPFVAEALRVCSGQVCLNEGVGMAARRIPAPLFRSPQATVVETSPSLHLHFFCRGGLASSRGR